MTYKIRINKYEIDIDAILVYAFFAMTMVLFLFRYNSIVYNIRTIILFIGGLRGYVICVKQKFIFPIGLAMFLFSCWFICLSIRNFLQPTHSTEIKIFAFSVCYIGLSVLLLKKSIGLLGSGILLLACSGIIIFQYLRGVDPQDVVINVSRNYVSILMLFFILLYYLALYKSKKRNPILVLLPSIVFFVVCVYAYGRGGILTSGFLMCGLFVYEFLNLNSKHARKGIRLFILIIVALIILYLILNGQITVSLGKFDVSIVDAARLNIWSSFFKNNTNSFVDFFCGSDASLIWEGENLHNSFFQCYARYGLIAFCVLIFLSVKAVIDGIRQRDFVWTLLALTLFIRAFTDLVFFEGYCEVFLYYFLIYWRYSKFHEKSLPKLQSTNVISKLKYV